MKFVNLVDERFPIGKTVDHYGKRGKVAGYQLGEYVVVNFVDSDGFIDRSIIHPDHLTLVRDDEEIVITITGRRWFQKSAGNTYHSCIVHVNGKYAGQSDFAYGYGDQYVQTGMYSAVEYIQEKYDFTVSDRVWGREAQKVKIISSVTDVPRKKDLAF